MPVYSICGRGAGGTEVRLPVEQGCCTSLSPPRAHRGHQVLQRPAEAHGSAEAQLQVLQEESSQAAVPLPCPGGLRPPRPPPLPS